jgi:flagellar biosynthesis GTPase FlhF
MSTEARTFLAKLEKVRLRKNRAATVLQKYARAWLGRRQYKATIQAAVLFQSSTSSPDDFLFLFFLFLSNTVFPSQVFRGAYAKKKEEDRLRREEEQRKREEEQRRLEECRLMKAEDHYSRAMAKEWKRQEEEEERLRREEEERRRVEEEERKRLEEEERKRQRRLEKLRKQEEEKKKAREMEQKMKFEIMKGDQQQKELLDQLNELQQRYVTALFHFFLEIKETKQLSFIRIRFLFK